MLRRMTARRIRATSRSRGRETEVCVSVYVVVSVVSVVRVRAIYWYTYSRKNSAVARRSPLAWPLQTSVNLDSRGRLLQRRDKAVLQLATGGKLLEPLNIPLRDPALCHRLLLLRHL